MRTEKHPETEQQPAGEPTPVLAGQLDALELLPDWR
ncbi:hypothetical protein H4W28_000031 [Micrococcus yunnanensis]|nr:hypothetical protein [Micrococcus yunnanensis]